ncbi:MULTISPECIES: MFS transporter [Methylobacterium]|uniref:MFS transporter n=1 Tax=Methylobacterium TaxID=407 RepID=UPI000FDDE467|nr:MULTISPECIES: MFS transporter [unclassified Methylobacterium]MBY0251847.1 MFS transporter [Methylobacterium organophilum]MCX7335275.1 MFS transporter [Hyphomicrobiales bacterium]MBP2493858.1 MFS transporter (putative signal transducer) [Methylobacterium sp. PvP105]MBP2499768.1 MFS transporter (putative signal transducer) [Methylobacterium sp. PvP109]MCX4197951.1 MFS transporter [Methylobacterium organophilum]
MTGSAGPAIGTRVVDTLAGLRPLAPFFCLYVTFGATLGFLSGGAPLILRARGVELAEVGLLQLINLPVGLTFLWAPLLDRLRLPFLSHRIGWIAAAQAASVLLLAVLSLGETWPLLALLALAIAACACVATMDIALEALVVETVPAGRRAFVASAKLCGASLGGILGVGVLVGSYDSLGWRGAVLACAALDALCLLPILGYREAPPRGAGGAAGTGAGPERWSGSLARLRRLAGRVLVLGAYFAASYLVAGPNTLALLDLGVPLGQVGTLTGTVLPAVNLVMALAAGWLAARFGTVRLIAAGALGVLASGGLMVVACAGRMPDLGVAAAVLSFVAGGFLGVPVFNMIYRWAQGPKPATDYALLFGAAFFAAMPLRVAAPALAGWIGWPGYFAATLPLYAAAVAWLAVAVERTLRDDGAAR